MINSYRNEEKNRLEVFKYYINPIVYGFSETKSFFFSTFKWQHLNDGLRKPRKTTLSSNKYCGNGERKFPVNKLRIEICKNTVG